MNRGIVHALVALGAILLILLLFDRPDCMRFISSVRGFVLDHWEAVIVAVLAMIGARLVVRSSHQIDRL